MKIYLKAGVYTAEELKEILEELEKTTTPEPKPFPNIDPTIWDGRMTTWNTDSCACRKENGGSGICGCVLGSMIIS